MKKEKEFSNVSTDKLNKTTLLCGRQILYPEAEKEIVLYIEFNRKLSNPISTWPLLLKLYKKIPERKNIPIKNNQIFIYRLLKRNGYTFRTKTHVVQALTKDCFIQASFFLKECWDKIYQYHFWNDIICNKEETPMFFNMIPTKTVARKGQKISLLNPKIRRDSGFHYFFYCC